MNLKKKPGIEKDCRSVEIYRICVSVRLTEGRF